MAADGLSPAPSGSETEACLTVEELIAIAWLGALCGTWRLAANAAGESVTAPASALTLGANGTFSQPSTGTTWPGFEAVTAGVACRMSVWPVLAVSFRVVVVSPLQGLGIVMKLLPFVPSKTRRLRISGGVLGTAIVNPSW